MAPVIGLKAFTDFSNKRKLHKIIFFSMHLLHLSIGYLFLSEPGVFSKAE